MRWFKYNPIHNQLIQFIMKNVSNTLKPVKSETEVLSNFTENQILSLLEMNCVRGGDPEGDPIIIIPPKH